MDAADADGDTALHECLRSDALAQLKRLQESGDLGGFLAGTSSSIQLLESGPSRNAAAAIAGTLVAHGADVNLRNLKQQTPLDLCADRALRSNLVRAFEQRCRLSPSSTAAASAESATAPQQQSGNSNSAHSAHANRDPRPQRPHQRSSSSSTNSTSALASAGLVENDMPRCVSHGSSIPILSVASGAPAAASSVSLVPSSNTEVVVSSQQPPSRSGATARRSSSAVECLVCSDSARDTLFDPCGHVCACFACAARVKKCLLCRTAVISRVRIEECLVCSDRHAAVLFRPCRHLVACESCARLMKKCVLCRAPIEQTIPFATLCGSDTGSETSAPETSSPRHQSTAAAATSAATGALVLLDSATEQSTQLNNAPVETERP